MSALTPSSQHTADNSALIRPELQIMKAVNLLLIAFCGWFFLTFLYTGIVLNLSLKFFFLAILVLTLRRWTGALLLALLQTHLYFLEPRGVSDPISEFVWVMATVVLIMAVSRFRCLQDIDQHSTVRRLLSELTSSSAHSHRPTSQTMSQSLTTAILTVGRCVLLLIACVLLALLVMSLVPVDTTFTGLNTIREYRLRPSGYRVIMLGLLLFAVFVVAWLAINEGVWRRLSATQAGIYLRSVFLKWLHRDVRMVIKGRLRRRRRTARRAERAELNPIPDPTAESKNVPSDS